MTQVLFFNELETGAQVSLTTDDRGTISGQAGPLPAGLSSVFAISTVFGVSDSLASTTPTAVAGAIVGGYDAPQDGGGAPYFWDPASTATPFAGLVVNPTGHVGPGRWHLLFEGPIPAASCGFKGSDNVANAPINTAAMAALTAFIGTGFGNTVEFLRGIFYFSDTINLTGMNGLILKGQGQNATLFQFVGTGDPTKTFVLMSQCPFSILEDLEIVGSTPGGGAEDRLGIVVNITSGGGGGPGPIQAGINRCTIVNGSNACVQIGSSTNIDVNTDRIWIHETSIIGGDHCQFGLRVLNGNTNNFEIKHSAISNNTTAGIEIGLFPRGTLIENVQMSINGTADILVRRTFGAGLEINSMQSEISGYPFLVVEDIAGGVAAEGMIKINMWGASFDPAFDNALIDYRGSGILHLVDCNLDGATTIGGSQSAIIVNPTAVAGPGPRLFITEGVMLNEGAHYEVRTTGNQAFRHVDLGTSIDTTLGDIDPSRPNLRLTEGLQAQAWGEFIRVASPGITIRDIPICCSKTWIFDVDFSAFVDASPNSIVIFFTVPVKCKIRDAWYQVDTGFAGVAGSITFQVGYTGAGGTNAFLVAHDVTTASASGTYVGQSAADLGAQLDPTTGEPFGFMIATGAVGGHGQLACELISVGGFNLGNGSVTNLTAGHLTLYVVFDEMLAVNE